MSANTCVFIPRQLNLHSACWSLASYYFSLIKYHGIISSRIYKHSSGCDAFRVIFMTQPLSWQPEPPMLLQDACSYLKSYLFQVYWPRDAVPPVAADRSAENVQTGKKNIYFSGTNYPGSVSPHLVLIHACFQTHFLPWRHESEHLSCLSVTQ